MKEKKRLIGYIATSKYGNVYEHPLNGKIHDAIFIDKVSVRKAKRPELEKMIESYLEENDIVHVYELNELGRSLRELQSVIERILSKGAEIVFQQEDLRFDRQGDNGERGRGPLWYLQLYGRFESSIVRKKQKDGIEAARKAGKHLGRPVKITQDQKEEILEKLQEGESPTQIAKTYAISRGSVYKILADSKKEPEEGEKNDERIEHGVSSVIETTRKKDTASLAEMNKAIAHRLTEELYEKYGKKLSPVLEELLVDILEKRHKKYGSILDQVTKHTGFTKYKSNYLMSRILPKLQHSGLVAWGGERGDEIFWE